MSIIGFKATVGDAALKKDGKVIIKLEASVSDMTADELHTLTRMLGTKVDAELDTNTVEYRVEIDIKRNQPTKTYKVNQDGTVDEVKTVDPQMTIEDAGVDAPKEKPEVREDIETVERHIVDSFIRENLAPKYDDLKIDMYDILTRRDAGDSYREIAKDYGLKDKELQEAMKEYRQRVAPMAKAWYEWLQKGGKTETSPDAQNSPVSGEEVQTNDMSSEGENGENNHESGGEETNRQDDVTEGEHNEQEKTEDEEGF